MHEKRDDRQPPRRADAWGLDPDVLMLNHGSFGACPRAVLQRQQELREQLEREPVRFFMRKLQPLLDQSRQTLAELVGAEPVDVVFVRNATTGVNAVLRSLPLRPGDELLVTDHDYNACRNVVDFVAERAGANVVTAAVPLPVRWPGQVVDAVLARVTERTRLAVIDHITSPTAVVFPIEEIARQLDRRGVDLLVDGAHGPGMVPLELARSRVAYYAGNCHKWLCAPKGAGFLYVRPDRQAGLQPAVISHGYNMARPGHTRMQDAFDWPGTDDPTPWLCVGEAIRFLQRLGGDGLPGLMRRNRQLALAGRQTLCDRLGLEPVCGEEMLGSMAAVRLPDDPPGADVLDRTSAISPIHRMQISLFEQFGIEVPIYHWPSAPQKLLRISAQAYNHPADYERLADALRGLLERKA